MKLNWLKNVKPFEVSYVDRPMIDKRFIAIKMVEYKNVIPFKRTTPLPENTPWDAGAEIKKAEPKDLKIMCAWYDEKNPDVKGSYKLPHHKAEKGYPVVWNGVKAAMGALMGARGGVMLPASDRRGVYNHLAKHYKQFEKEVPEFKELDELDKSFIDKIADKIKSKLNITDTKVGRVLSKANETKLMDAANDIIKAGNTIKDVLASVNKIFKKEDSDMDEKEVKDIVEKVVEEKIDTFKEDIEAKLEELLSDDNDNDNADNDSKNDDSKDDDNKDNDKKNLDDKKKKSSRDSDEDNDDFLGKISEIVDKKFNEVKSEVDKIKKELKIKPSPDKKKVKKDIEDNKSDDEDVDFTGVFRIRDI